MFPGTAHVQPADVATPDRNSEAAPNTEDGEEAEDAGEQGGKRCSKGGGPSSAAKRPRYGGKAFADLTVAELENAVRDLAALERQIAAKDDLLAKLQEKVSDKTALVKQVKALEGDLAAQQKEAEKFQSLAKSAVEEPKLHAEQVVEAIRKQCTAQMVYCAAFKDQLSRNGRDVTAFVPNISPEVLKLLGGEPGWTVTKYSDVFFGHRVTKATANSGVKLELRRPLKMKYVKTTRELRVDASYQMEGAKRKKVEKVAAKKTHKKQRGADAAANDEEDEEEDDDDEGAEDGEGDDGDGDEADGAGGPPCLD